MQPNLFEHILEDESSNELDICGCKIQPKWLSILCSVSHFLLTFNSSANFVIYYSTERNFKSVLLNMIKKIKCLKIANNGEKYERSEISDLRFRSELLEMKEFGET